MILDQIIHGLVIGSLIAFVAVGYALIYSILKFINFAHGEVLALGGYLCFVFHNTIHIEPFGLSVLLAVMVTGFAGVLIEKAAYKPLRQRGRFSMLLSSLGISIALQAMLALIFGSSALVYGVQDPTLSVGRYPLYAREILVIGILIVVFLGVHWALRRSMIGLSVRSIAANSVRAMLLGVPVDRIISITFFSASALAAIAGISIGVASGLTPNMGFQYSIWAFAVAVIAGLGSIRGILIGGLLFGIVINLAIAYGSSLFANAIALIFMAIILLIRPQGLFVFERRTI